MGIITCYLFPTISALLVLGRELDAAAQLEA